MNPTTLLIYLVAGISILSAIGAIVTVWAALGGFKALEDCNGH